MNPFSLSGKQVLVTGASSGIGRQAAISISKAGAKVWATARDEHRLNDTFGELAEDGHAKFKADLTDEIQQQALVDQLPELNGVVHCAGMIKPYPVKFIGKKQLDELYAINYDAPVLLMSKLFKAKKIMEGTSIVFISSVSSRFPHKGGALYSGTKAAIDAYSKVIALEYANKRIRSNCINAAMVKTPLFDAAEEAVTAEMMDAHRKQYPLGFGEPEDVAHAVVYLLSDASKWVTGTNLLLDGGLLAGI